MLKILWLELKNYLKGNKAVFILSVLAFTCSCVTINLTMWHFLQANAERKAYEESYADKVFYKITLEGGTEVYQRIFGDGYREQIKTAFEQLSSAPLFQYKYRADGGLQFFDPYGNSYGADDFPPYRKEFLSGYEEGMTGYSVRDDYLSLKAIYADRLLINEPNVSLASGEWFSDGGFYVDDPNDIHLPVIMGADYRDLYEIGDTLTNAHYGSMNPITLCVTGFLKRDSWYYDNNNQKQMMNRYMVIPSPEVTYNYVLEDGTYDGFFKACYDSFKMTNARIVCDKENAEAVEKQAYQIFKDNKLYEFKLNYETSAAQRGLEEIRSLTVSSMAISVFTLLLSILMFSIQAHYKLIKYKKKYGIYMMSGITATRLLMIIILDTILLFVLTNILTVLVYNVIGFMTVALSVHTVIVILALEFALLCFMGLSGHIKVHQINMSAALREHE